MSKHGEVHNLVFLDEEQYEILNKEGKLYVEEFPTNIRRSLNTGNKLFVRKEGTNETLLVQVAGPTIQLVENKLTGKLGRDYGIGTKDFGQASAVESMLDENIEVTTVFGKAGCGKTFLAMAMATLLKSTSEKYNRIVLVKPLVQVGSSKVIGTLPGTLEEKVGPYMTSFEQAVESLPKKLKRNYYTWEAKGHIEFFALEHMRGTSFKDTIIIVDEVQNISLQDFKTLCTRLDKGSKLFLVGDARQSDLNKKSDFVRVINHSIFKNYPKATVTYLENTYRTGFVDVVETICEDLENQDCLREEELLTPLSLSSLDMLEQESQLY